MNDLPTVEGDPLALLQRIDPVCLRFERRWKEGGRPALAEELLAAPEADRAALLGELLPLEWSYRRRLQESFTREEYRARFAGLSAVIDAAWERWIGGSTADGSQSPSTVLPGPRPTLRPSGIGATTELPACPSGYERMEHLG